MVVREGIEAPWSSLEVSQVLKAKPIRAKDQAVDSLYFRESDLSSLCIFQQSSSHNLELPNQSINLLRDH